jgi:Vitamin K-dependent gamma-carboxylase
MFSHLYDFVHARAGLQGCRLAGLMRLLLGLAILYDRLFLGLDLRKYFHPTTGLLPYSIAAVQPHQNHSYTVFSLAPNSWTLVVVMYGLGVIHAFLLALGVAPRLNGIGLYFHLYNFGNHNFMLWDGEDDMMRIYLFLLLWLPLDHRTIYDRFGTSDNKASSLSSTWPMWPFRLWQIYICIVYFGCSGEKIVSEHWRDGTALYHVSHTTDWYPGIFNPDFLFNRMWFLRLCTYGSMFIEFICWIFIWPRATRKAVLALVFLFHFGIEVTMTMHVFEWVAMIGWMVFLVDPTQTVVAHGSGTETKVKSLAFFGHKHGKTLMETLVFSLLLVSFAADLPNNEGFLKLVPRQDLLYWYYSRPMYYATTQLTLFRLAKFAGIVRGGRWTLFENVIACNTRYEATIVFANYTDHPTMNGEDLTVTWESTNFASMSGWEKKRHTRNMNYNDELGSFPQAQKILCEHLMRQYDEFPVSGGIHHANNHVQSVSLDMFWESSLPPPADLDWFRDSARQEMESDWDHLYTINRDRENVDPVELHDDSLSASDARLNLKEVEVEIASGTWAHVQDYPRAD